MLKQHEKYLFINGKPWINCKLRNIRNPDSRKLHEKVRVKQWKRQWQLFSNKANPLKKNENLDKPKIEKGLNKALCNTRTFIFLDGYRWKWGKCFSKSSEWVTVSSEWATALIYGHCTPSAALI